MSVSQHSACEDVVETLPSVRYADRCVKVAVHNFELCILLCSCCWS